MALALAGMGTAACKRDPGVAIYLKEELASDSADSGLVDNEWPTPPTETDACLAEEPNPQIGPWADTFPIPGASFEQGCTQPEELPCYPNEFPVHSVSVSDVEAMATEVSQELWLAVQGDNPSGHRSCGCNCPVENLTWNQAVAFANALSEAQGQPQAYVIEGADVQWDTESTGWRLPTEAEWERMAKGSNDDLVAGGVDVGAAAWYRENAPEGPKPVGLKDPTENGIHDLNGNVWEWTWDWSAPYDGDAAHNPTGPSTGIVKVLRGGSYADDYRVVRTSVRRELPADQSSESVGLRLVRGAHVEAP